MIYSKEVEEYVSSSTGRFIMVALLVPDRSKMGTELKKLKTFQVLHMVLAGVLHSRVHVSLH